MKKFVFLVVASVVALAGCDKDKGGNNNYAGNYGNCGMQGYNNGYGNGRYQMVGNRCVDTRMGNNNNNAVDPMLCQGNGMYGQNQYNNQYSQYGNQYGQGQYGNRRNCGGSMYSNYNQQGSYYDYDYSHQWMASSACSVYNRPGFIYIEVYYPNAGVRRCAEIAQGFSFSYGSYGSSYGYSPAFYNPGIYTACIPGAPNCFGLGGTLGISVNAGINF